MITIRAVSFNGQPPAHPLGFQFDELGGTIGRADTNELVLPDAERHVSRLQARIVWRNGQFEIANVGANPVEVGDRSVPNGAVAPIRAGDLITLGGYVLEVMDEAAAPVTADAGTAAPVDDPLGLFGSSAGRAHPEAGSGAGRPAQHADAAGPFDDPFAQFSAAPASHPGTARSASPVPTAGRTPERSGAHIPDDFDPFADPFARPPVEVPLPASKALDDLGFGPTGESVSGAGIDTMFGLAPTAPATGKDPLAGSALAAPPAGEAEGGQVVDPLAALSGVRSPAARPAPVPDQVPEVQGAYRPPAAAIPGEAFLSWKPAGEGPDEGGERRDEVPPRGEAPLAPDRQRSEAELSSGVPSGQRSVRAGSGAPATGSPLQAPVSVKTVAGPGSKDEQGLLHALLKGLGMPDLSLLDGLTPETMELVGGLLREATEGTLDLLLARAVTKREVRAEVTMIVSHDNNPLKFSPNVEAALAHLLAPRGRGFLPPREAMRDAYDDLRSHEIGFMAGMRAALAGVLHRFDPAVLEQRLSGKSMLDSVLPMNRRARLWDLYTELYREIACEAEDDFHALFGREFLRAYEAQVERLKDRDS